MEITEEYARELELEKIQNMKDKELLYLIDRKLNTIFEEILYLQMTLEDKKNVDIEKELKEQERELNMRKEDLLYRNSNKYDRTEKRINMFRQNGKRY